MSNYRHHEALGLKPRPDLIFQYVAEQPDWVFQVHRSEQEQIRLTAALARSPLQALRPRRQEQR